MHFNSQKGVTLIEISIVIGLLLVIGATISPFFSNFILRNYLETTTDQILSSIKKAQNYSMDGKNNTAWGVCLFNGNIRLFSVSCNSPTIKEDYSVAGSVTVSGLNDTTFSSLRGEPSNPLTITITTAIDSKTIILNSAGGIEVN